MEDKIKDIKNRLKNASKNWKWDYYFDPYGEWGCYFEIPGVLSPKRYGSIKDSISISKDDAIFIENARSDIEYLLSLAREKELPQPPADNEGVR